MEKNIVVSYTSDNAGCGYYRTQIPLTILQSKNKIVPLLLPSFTGSLEILSSAKVMLWQRQCTRSQALKFVELYKLRHTNNLKYRMVYELDDLIHEICPTNKQAYEYYDKNKLANAVEIMRRCDRVIFSTEYLKKYYKEKHGINSVVSLNKLPRFLWDSPRRTKNQVMITEKPRILWSGSSSHLGVDIPIVDDLIKYTHEKYQWVYMGPPTPTVQNKKYGVEIVKWVDFMSYANAVRKLNIDICLAPLAPHKFNYGKSDLKFLESTAISCPCVCSDIGEHGPYLNTPNLVKNDRNAFMCELDKLTSNPDYYWESLQKSWKYLDNGRWMEDEINSFYKLLFT